MKLKHCVITRGKGFHLKDHDPDDRAGIGSDEEATVLLRTDIDRLLELQDKLYAQDQWGLLVIFQAMDAAGKDSAIKHVMSGVNPMGCSVHSFKAPSAEELDHDYLWRAVKALPERGRIGIFNRSYYEETLIVRVHPGLLQAQRLPVDDRHVWRHRFEDISAFERYLTRNGFVIRKFFLHISRGEQRRRFLARLEHPGKNWKFSMQDVEERRHWDEYMDCYEQTIRHTAAPDAPWIVVPANDKKRARAIVARVIIEALEGLGLSYPPLDAARKRDLGRARRLLLRARRF